MLTRIKRAFGFKSPPPPVPPDPNYTENVWMLNGYCQKNSEYQDLNTVRFYNANIDPVQPNSIAPISILDGRYAPIGGNGTAGVTSFDGRTGDVKLLASDITPVTAPLYAPLTGEDNQTFFSYTGDANFTVGGQPMDLAWSGSFSLAYSKYLSWTAVTSPAYLSSSINLTPQNIGLNTKSGTNLLLDQDVTFVASNNANITVNRGNMTIGSTGEGYVYTGLQKTSVIGQSVTLFSNNVGFQGATGCLTISSDNTGTALTYSSPLTVWTANSVLTRSYADARYMFANAPAGGVTSFNTRTGAVTLQASDVTPITNPLYLAAITKAFGAFGNANYTGNVTETSSGYGFVGTAYQSGVNPNGHTAIVAGIAKTVTQGGWAAGYDNPASAELYCYNGAVSNNARLLISSGGNYYDCTLSGALPKSWSDSSLLTRSYADTRYMSASNNYAPGYKTNANATSGVTANYTAGTASLTGTSMNFWGDSVDTGIFTKNGGANPQNIRAFSGLSYGSDNLSIYPELKMESFNYWPNNTTAYQNSTTSNFYLTGGSPGFLWQGRKYSASGTMTDLAKNYFQGSASGAYIGSYYNNTSISPKMVEIGILVNSGFANNTFSPSVTISGQTAYLVWSDYSILTRLYADGRYAPRVAALTGREPITTEIPIGDKFLQVEEGRIVGWITAAERESWIQETDELKLKMIAESKGE